MTFRQVLFWIHLIAGVVAGAVIAVMCFTGAILAFESEIVAWAERDARQVAVPEPAVRRPLEELLARAQAERPDTPITAITVAADPRAAVSVAFGREATYHVNPYTADVRTPRSTAVHDFMHVMVDWHRYLARSGDQRPVGKAITGACNAAFFVLGVTGLYLWWPRRWTWRTLRPSVWFVRAQGKARDWNWHNVIGVWALPVLIVLTASGMVISYRWASDLVYRTVGETPPAQRGPGAASSAGPVRVNPPHPGATPLGPAAWLAAAEGAIPGWETLTLRFGGPGRGRGASAGTESAGPSPVMIQVRELDRFPTFASTTLALDPFTGAVLERTPFSALTPGRQARMWMRWLHVGQGFGWGGQLIAGLACIGGLVLVYTGFALACRRFFGGRRSGSTGTRVAAADSAPGLEPAARP